ncbi:MAG: SDR family oxidoreductase [Victivallaceae bacterium]|nr:SDR family oxidoreductase [Victivallaceae bacterium]
MDKGFFRLDGKTALVTGAATGLGQAVAAALARAGADIVITDKPGVSLDSTRNKIAGFGHRIADYALDVREIGQIRKIVDMAAEKFGKIDILVNNAGINRPAPGLEVSAENWEDHFNTNVRGGFFAAQAAAPYMIKNGWGRIIFISSQSGLIGIPGQPVYCSTKGAVIQLVRTLGVEWAKHGITVNSIAPTFIETDLTRKRLQDPEFRKFVLGKIPRGELAYPEDVGAAAVYLAGEEAGMINCHTLSVDGGWTAW